MTLSVSDLHVKLKAGFFDAIDGEATCCKLRYFDTITKCNIEGCLCY